MLYPPEGIDHQEQKQNGGRTPQAASLASLERGEMATAPTGHSTRLVRTKMRWWGTPTGSIPPQPRTKDSSDKQTNLPGREVGWAGFHGHSAGLSSSRCLGCHFDHSTALWGEKNPKNYWGKAPFYLVPSDKQGLCLRSFLNISSWLSSQDAEIFGRYVRLEDSEKYILCVILYQHINFQSKQPLLPGIKRKIFQTILKWYYKWLLFNESFQVHKNSYEHAWDRISTIFIRLMN